MVSRDSVCIAFIMAVSHDQEVRAANILNAYMMSPKREKIWTALGPEFGDDAGKSAIIIKH